MKADKKTLFCCVLPLVISLIIYLLFRPRTVVVNRLVFHFAEPAPAPVLLSHFRWINYNLPGGLWLFSYLSFSSLQQRRMLRLMPLMLALGIEALQWLQLTDGTFDIWDIIFYALAWLAFVGLPFSPGKKPPEISPGRKISYRYQLAFVMFMLIVMLSDVWIK